MGSPLAAHIPERDEHVRMRGPNTSGYSLRLPAISHSQPACYQLLSTNKLALCRQNTLMGVRPHHTSWPLSGDDLRLKTLLDQQMPVRQIARLLGRTESAVRNRMYLKGLNLKAALVSECPPSQPITPQ